MVYSESKKEKDIMDPNKYDLDMTNICREVKVFMNEKNKIYVIKNEVLMLAHKKIEIHKLSIEICWLKI